MVPIRSRWHDGGISEVPPGAPARQAGLVFALCGLRLQAEGISPGPIEATVTITGKRPPGGPAAFGCPGRNGSKDDRVHAGPSSRAPQPSGPVSIPTRHAWVCARPTGLASHSPSSTRKS
jgi:hypothetical protein